MRVVRRLLKSFVVCAALVCSIPAHAVTPDVIQSFIFRYKLGTQDVANAPAPVSKDITAFFVGGVGYSFDEELPLKDEWKDDRWRVVGGTLPDGIEFNEETRRFVGTPKVVVADHAVELKGFDGSGTSVAEAKVVFDFVEVMGVPVVVDLYAHTNHYKVDELKIPAGVTVDEWIHVYKPADGLSVNGPYFEGTPTRSGVSPVLSLGKNYMGETVVTFIGKYTVEDGPQFPFVKNDVRNLPSPYGAPPLMFDIRPPTVKHTIGDPAKVKYVLQVRSGDSLPMGLTYGMSPARITGSVTLPYETATAQWKAIDADGTVGFSNWFEFGTGHPNPACGSKGKEVKLTFVTGREHSIPVGRVVGGFGVQSYAEETGKLPAGLRFDEASGTIVGSPLAKTERSQYVVRTTVTNGDEAVSTLCYYELVTFNGGFDVVDETPPQSSHVRLGDIYGGTVSIKGGIKDFDTSIADEGKDTDFHISTSPSKNAETVGVMGRPSSVGRHEISVISVNGDGNTRSRNLHVQAYGNLAFGQEMPTVVVKRLEEARIWARVPYDPSTVIPDVALQDMPKFALTTSSELPLGIRLTPEGAFEGGTAVSPQTYGPYAVALSDYTGDSVVSNIFNIMVVERDRISIGLPVSPVFTVETDGVQEVNPFVVKQPAMAANFKLKFRLRGEDLPEWLTFNEETGKLSASSKIPYGEIGSYGPYTAEVTDEDGSTDITSPFFISAADRPRPSASVASEVKGSVSGDASRGETETILRVSGLRDLIDEDSVIGGLASVKFTSAEPQCPSGVCFDQLSGSFDGVPKSAFEGNVVVRYEDARNRKGEIIVPMQIRPYPRLSLVKSEMEVARLSVANGEAVVTRDADHFWSDPIWGVDVSKGTDLSTYGLGVDAVTGGIVGRTDAPSGTTISNIVLVATSTGANGEKLKSFSPPFAVKVGDAKPFQLAYSPDQYTLFNDRNADGTLSYVRENKAAPRLSGSYVAPVTFSIVDRATVPASVGVDQRTGAITGNPYELGEWKFLVSAEDAEGRSISAPATLRLKSTLDGKVLALNTGGTHVLRVDEPFATDPISVTNEVLPVRFVTTPSILPPTLAEGFDSQTGSFSDVSFFGEKGDLRVTVDVIDGHDRSFYSPPPTYDFQVKDRLQLKIESVAENIRSKQYASDRRIDIAFAPMISNAIGSVRFALEGDVPGTLVYVVYDENEQLLGWQWVDSSGFHEIKGISGADDLYEKLPLDALVFDTVFATLNGIPSRHGSFNLSLVAYDSHGDTYIRDVASRVDFNKASVAVTMTVDQADPLTVSNNMDSETLSRYTSTASVVSRVQGAAYGRPLIWSPGSGRLPSGIMPKFNGDNVAYDGYPTEEGTFADIRWHVQDAAGRKTPTAPVTFLVGEREPLRLVAETPTYVIVNETLADATVTSVNNAFDRTIPAADWSVSGRANLPLGIDYEVRDGGVVFHGSATAVGSYGGITVSAKDSLGQVASIPMRFEVLDPQGPIGLDVENIRTKVGYPFQMLPRAFNTYGTVRFYSNDIAGELSTQLNLDARNGKVSGLFDTVGNRDFDVYVTDATNRVTSKPIIAEVMPFLRVTVPQIVAATQGDSLVRDTTTSYVLGDVSYQKDGSGWPDGISVDQKTGSIIAVDASGGTEVNRVTAAAGLYPGLKIRAIDTFSVGSTMYKDEQISNTFALRVDPSDIAPDIQDPTGLKVILGAEGKQLSWTPTVYESGTSRKWNFGGTIFAASHDLTEYGLSFDDATGEIRGTPIKPFIIRDFTISVVSQRGDGDVTRKFWIGVAPEEALQAEAGQTTNYSFRVKRQGTTRPIIVENYIGLLSFSRATPSGMVLDPSSGSLSVPDDIVAGKYSDTVHVVDEFGRSFDFGTEIQLLPRITLSVATVPAKILVGEKYKSIRAVTLGNTFGITSFKATGLPGGWTLNDTTGAISGSFDKNDTAERTVSLTVTDSFDGETETITYSLKPTVPQSARYWRLSFAPGSGQHTDVRLVNFMGVDGVNHSLRVGEQTANPSSSPLTAPNNATLNNIRVVFDGSSEGNYTAVNPVGGLGYIMIDFLQNPASVVGVYYESASLSQYWFVNEKLEYSANGTTWTTLATSARSTPIRSGELQGYQ